MWLKNNTGEGKRVIRFFVGSWYGIGCYAFLVSIFLFRPSVSFESWIALFNDILQKNSDGMEKEIKGASDACYTPSSDDIGCTIYVSCEPVRNDGACGPTVLSELVGPVLPGL